MSFLIEILYLLRFRGVKISRLPVAGKISEGRLRARPAELGSFEQLGVSGQVNGAR